jgi:AraC-like DNA-binding protein
VDLGAVTVGRCRCPAGISARVDDLESFYEVNVPRAGSVLAEHRNAVAEASPGRAAVYQPAGEVRMLTSAPYDSYVVRVGRQALEDALAAWLDRPVTHPLEIRLLIDLRSPEGTRLVRLVRLLGVGSETRTNVLMNPMVAAPLHDAVLVSLLGAADHHYREMLEHPVASWGPMPVFRAVEAMNEQPAEPYTPAVLAEVAGESVRCLHEGFRRHVGPSPMQYLRQVRLDRSHDELRAGEPGETTVSGVAQKWGFPSVDRYTTDHLQAFGVTPSQTLGDRDRRPALRS